VKRARGDWGEATSGGRGTRVAGGGEAHWSQATTLHGRSEELQRPGDARVGEQVLCVVGRNGVEGNTPSPPAPLPQAGEGRLGRSRRRRAENMGRKRREGNTGRKRPRFTVGEDAQAAGGERCLRVRPHI